MVAQKRRIEPVDEPVFPEGPVDDELPALLDPQLRRRSDLAQKTRYFSESRGRVLLPRRVDRERIPPPVPRDSRDAPLELAPRRDGFLVRAVAADPAEYVPDVGDERAQSRDDGRALHVLRHEPAPAVVVLHLVEDVLAVSAVPVKLGDSPRTEVEVRDERVPLVSVRVHPVVRRDEFEPWDRELDELAARGLLPPLLHVLHRTTHEDDPARPAPAAEDDPRVDALPAVARILPVRPVREMEPEYLADVLRALDLEEIAREVVLAAADHHLVAEADVSPDELRPEPPRKPPEEPVEHLRRVDARGLVARVDDDAEDEPQPRDAERVVAVRGTSGLLRVVAERRPLLVAVKRLHRRVHVEDVVLVQQGLDEAQVLVPDPLDPRLHRDRLEVPPHGVARQEPPDPEELGGDRVAGEVVEVPIAVRAVRHPDDSRAERLAVRRRVVARQFERACVDEVVEHAARREERAEEGVVRARRQRDGVVPAQSELSAEGAESVRLFNFPPRSERIRGILSHVVLVVLCCLGTQSIPRTTLLYCR